MARHKITSISIKRMYESCERTTFYVDLTTDEGFMMTADSFATGSLYTNGEGLSIDEARDRALTEAHNWADFLGIELAPYVEDNVTYEPEMKLEIYETLRELGEK